MRKSLLAIWLSTFLYADIPQTLASLSLSYFDILNQHTHLLNEHLGDLLQYRFNDGIWIKTAFIQQRINADSIYAPSRSQNLLIEGGYDHNFILPNGQNFLGGSLEYARGWIDLDFNQGSSNTLALSFYNLYLHSSRFYVSTFIKYLYNFNSFNQNTHLLYTNLELGQKFPIARYFFIQPAGALGFGFSPSSKLSFENTSISSSSQFPFDAEIGTYLGVPFDQASIRGDVRLGGFFNYTQSIGSITLPTQTLRNVEEYKLRLKLGANLHFGDIFRLYLGTQTSFFGKINTEFGVNFGIRFLFGENYFKSKTFMQKGRNLNQIRDLLLYDSEQRRLRVQQRNYLTPQQLQDLYNTQEKRDNTNVKTSIQDEKNRRKRKEESRYMNTDKNNQNYQDRNFPALQGRDIKQMQDYNRREVLRKYGQ